MLGCNGRGEIAGSSSRNSVVIPGCAAWRRPGISRFRVRCFVSPRNDGAESRRDAVRGDDLIGGTAADLGPAVELPGETAGTGRCRAQLDDQLADLGLRHHGADAVPSRPALAGIEAE